MPAIGDVNNPGGANGGSYTSGTETPYGEIKRLTQLTEEAPIAPNSAVASPKRAQRAATRPAPAAAAAPTLVAAAPAPSIADVWAQIATTPGASPLAQEMAARAAAG